MHLGPFPDGVVFSSFVMTRTNYPFEKMSVEDHQAIFADLRRNDLVLSRRGARGGYVLGRAASEISVGDVFRAVDGPLAEVRGLRPHLREVLDDTSLADLRTGDLPPRVKQLLTAPDAWKNR